MSSYDVIDKLERMFIFAGLAGIALGIIFALLAGFRSQKNSSVSLRSRIRQWWWRMPLAVVVAAALGAPLGIGLLAVASGIGMSAGSQPGGGGALFSILIVFGGTSLLVSYTILKR